MVSMEALQTSRDPLEAVGPEAGTAADPVAILRETMTTDCVCGKLTQCRPALAGLCTARMVEPFTTRSACAGLTSTQLAMMLVHLHLFQVPLGVLLGSMVAVLA